MIALLTSFDVDIKVFTVIVDFGTPPLQVKVIPERALLTDSVVEQLTPDLNLLPHTGIVPQLVPLIAPRTFLTDFIMRFTINVKLLTLSFVVEVEPL